jgi:hypothetical protein
MEAWRRLDAKWLNTPARDRLGRPSPRRQRPDPPAWLSASCQEATRARVLDLVPRLATACRLLEDPWAAVPTMPTAVQAQRAEAEKPDKYSKFLRRVHIDGLWTTPAINSRFYGLIGAHVTLVDVGPLQVFGPPGVLVLSLPEAGGSRRISIGYTWGLSIRLTDMQVLGGKHMTLFLNLSKVWIGGQAEGRTTGGYDIIGFSLAPGKKRSR